jgi:hypothetical protein
MGGGHTLSRLAGIDPRKTLLQAALALSLNFDTWQFLIRRQRLTDDQAIELMVRMTCDCQLNEK